MAWVLLDDHFNDHPKAVQAGPVACWLFCCGLMYCRRHHTDGFIPHAAVPALVPAGKPQQSAGRLVEAHLWEAVEGGYRVHGYREMYDDEEAKAKQDDLRERRREYGRRGGLAKARNKLGDSASKEVSKTVATVPSKPLAHREGGEGNGSVHLVLGEESEKGNSAPPLDRWLMELQEDYPQNRVTYGYMTSSSFCDIFQGDTRPAREVWAEMRANLENQKAGHEWRVKGMVPKLETWLRDGRWKQHHDESPASELVSDKTAKTLTAAAAAKRIGRQ